MQDASMGKSLTPDVMTLEDVARYLQVSLSTAKDLAHYPGFPVVRFTGKTWRVPRWELDRWLSQQIDPPTPAPQTNGGETPV